MLHRLLLFQDLSLTILDKCFVTDFYEIDSGVPPKIFHEQYKVISYHLMVKLRWPPT